MIKATIVPVIALFFVMLASCDLVPDFALKDTDDTDTSFDTLEEGYFYARYMTADFRNMPNYGFYKVKAEPLYEGEKCVIWAETGSGVTAADAEKIAREYDNNIRQKIVDAFSRKDFAGSYEGEMYYFDDMLDYANWLAGRDDKKLTILLLDIQDDFNPQTNASYVAGYFYSGNFLPEGKFNNEIYSNGRDMIYVDTYPGRTEPTQVYATFAHELQHLINYYTCILLGKDLTNVWVNEGLSAYAEYLYLGRNPEDRCEWLSDSRNTVRTGNNFFVWGNHSDELYAIQDDYATVYLFFRWLYLQANTGLQPHIFRDITLSDYPDYRAVTSVAARINPAWGNWETLLGTWFAANHEPANPVYGYKGDFYLQEGDGSDNPYYKGIRIHPVGGSTVALYPGEGVYSIINGSYAAVNEGYIRYAELAGNTRNVKMLLTFNANTNNSAGRETGTLTGVSSSITVSRSAERTRPHVIDARDIWGRDQERFKFRLPR